RVEIQGAAAMFPYRIQGGSDLRISSLGGCQLDSRCKEMIMRTIKLTILSAAVVVGIPLAFAFAAQQFGSDEATVEPEQAVQSAPVVTGVKRFGGDSVFLTTDTAINRPGPTQFSGVALKPGRA